jgi:predicted amidohydrolase
MKIGVYQNHPEFGEKIKNIEKAFDDLQGADADLMILPELFSTGYQFISKDETRSLSEEIPTGITCKRLMEFARIKKMFLVSGLAERDGNKLYNSAVLIGPEGYIGRYRKVHLFAEEKDFFQPGDRDFRVFDIGLARIGIMICFDWQFPESARILTLMGADIICHPSNLVLPYCQKAMATRSLENGVFTATANRIGTESRGGKKPLVFTGCSQILDNKGETITSLGEDDVGFSIVEIDVNKARDKKVTAQNDRMGDRRPGLYSALVDL